MEGFAIRPSAGAYVTVEPVSSLAISGAFDEEAAKLSRVVFRVHDGDARGAARASRPAT